MYWRITDVHFVKFHRRTLTNVTPKERKPVEREKRISRMRERPYKRDLIGTRPWIIVANFALLVHLCTSDSVSHRLTTVKASSTWHGNLSMFNSRCRSFYLLLSSLLFIFATVITSTAIQ